MSSKSEELVTELQAALVEGNLTEAKALCQKRQNVEILKENPWEIIPTITAHITEDNEVQHEDLLATCVDLLKTVTDVCNADDVVLALHKEIAHTTDETAFTYLLGPLKTNLLKLPPTKPKYAVWCFDAIQSFLKNLPVPNNFNLEEKERIFMDTDSDVHRISSIYKVVYEFYEEIIDHFKDSCAVRIARQCSSQSSQENTAGKVDDEKYEENVRNKILEASLPFVLNHGWSKEALTAGAESIGYPGTTHGMFTAGGADLVLYFQTSSNQKLVDYLIKAREQHKDIPPVAFVEKACRYRLEMTVPYLPKWPQAIAIMSLPPNVPGALSCLLTMVDDICHHAGDRSVDFNWYARRIALAGVYKATELYLMQDKSPEYNETWNFLNRRLTEATQLNNLLQTSEFIGQNAKDTVTAAFTTARNILGLNKVT